MMPTPIFDLIVVGCRECHEWTPIASKRMNPVGLPALAIAPPDEYSQRAMSKAEILEQLPKLTPEERAEIIAAARKLDEAEWLDDGELTDEEKRLIMERLDACEKNPGGSIPWEQVKAELQQRFRR